MVCVTVAGIGSSDPNIIFMSHPILWITTWGAETGQGRDHNNGQIGFSQSLKVLSRALKWLDYIGLDTSLWHYLLASHAWLSIHTIKNLMKETFPVHNVTILKFSSAAVRQKREGWNLLPFWGQGRKSIDLSASIDVLETFLGGWGKSDLAPLLADQSLTSACDWLISRPPPDIDSPAPITNQWSGVFPISRVSPHWSRSRHVTPARTRDAAAIAKSGQKIKSDSSYCFSVIVCDFQILYPLYSLCENWKVCYSIFQAGYC